MVGLTLEGGGAKGAYQVGAWRAFRELNIDFQGISGTSVGALNGALMIQEDFDLAYELWHEITPNTILDVDDRIYEMLSDYELITDSFQLLKGEIKRIVKSHGLDVGPLKSLVHSNVNEEKIRRSRVDFGFVTVCVTDRKPMEIYKEDVPFGKMGDYLIASSYLPVFKSSKLDGKLFIDGAFYDNLPVNMLYKKGYRKIIAVRLLGKGRIKKIDHPDLEITYITPSMPLGNMLDFSRERARRNLKLGYLDTMKVMRKLKGRRYYLQGGIDDVDAFEFFTRLDEGCIQELANLFNLPQYLPVNRLLLEEVIPKFIYLLDLDKGATYGDVVEGLIETSAECLKIDPLKIYSLEELIDQILSMNVGHGKNQLDNKGNFILNEIIFRLDKEKLLKEAIRIMMDHHKNLWFL